MGDSIADGVLIEYSLNVGDFVEEDDVCAIMETDKVTVDVRSPVAGVITKVHAEVDEILPIGAPLLAIDQSQTAASGSTATKSEPVVPETPAPAAPTPPPAQPDTSSSSDSHAHKPLIRFRYGKRDTVLEPTPVPTKQKTVKAEPAKADTIELPTAWELQPRPVLPLRFQRKPLSAKEMLAIELGGAEPY